MKFYLGNLHAPNFLSIFIEGHKVTKKHLLLKLIS